MAKALKVIQLGNPILRSKAKTVSASEIKTKRFQNFCKQLSATCEQNNGVGIAAPQVGVLKRVYIVWSKPSKRYKHAPLMEPLIVINPKITKRSKKMEKGFEGCLSIPGIRGLVPRYKEIEVSYISKEGKRVKETYKDFVAKIFQHEGDHLDGIVFLDRADPKDLITEIEYQKLVKNK